MLIIIVCTYDIGYALMICMVNIQSSFLPKCDTILYVYLDCYGLIFIQPVCCGKT